jgi:putative DNA primase/helicase
MKYDIKQFHARAVDRWYEILIILGISEDILDGKHHPCPVCGGKDRFRFDNKNGLGTWFCNQCTPQAGDGIRLIQKVFGLNFVEALERIDAVIDQCKGLPARSTFIDPKIALNALWQSGIPINGNDFVSRYLHSRGLQLKPDNVKYCKYCYESSTRSKLPAMLAKIVDYNDRPISIHRTYLTLEGKQRTDLEKNKKVMPPTKLLQESSVRLFLPSDPRFKSNVLGVAEGIETAMAAAQITGIATWACISSTLMQSWKAPDKYRHIVVFTDNDSNFCGQAAGFVLAHNLSKQGRKVEIIGPDQDCNDFNDQLLEHQAGEDK